MQIKRFLGNSITLSLNLKYCDAYKMSIFYRRTEQLSACGNIRCDAATHSVAL
jgi:hypothetical protein